MTNRDAYDEGYDAYWDGRETEDNPYDAADESDQRESWETGWRDARKHDYDESEG